MSSETRREGPSGLPPADAYLAYRKGMFDGRNGRPLVPFGTTIEELAAYREGYAHGDDERGYPLQARAAGAVVALSVVALAWWWFR